MQQRALPVPTGVFCDKKARILRQLGAPAAEYVDASPKGSVDAGIRDLIDEINGADGLVTTSSCGGRVSVFREGRKTRGAEQERDQVAGVGGKGAGGTWLFVSHDPVVSDRGSWADALGFADFDVPCPSGVLDKEQRRIHFKFEPMILHVLAASPAHAQLLLRAALQAGFRESGAINLAAPATPMVAVRSMGLGFESLIGYEAPDGQRCCLVSAEYLAALLAIGNERFAENARRIARFRAAFRDALAEAPGRLPGGRGWEVAAARRERMRAEGLGRQAALAAERSQGSPQPDEAEP